MSLTSYRAAPPRVTIFHAAPKQPEASFVFRSAERNGGGLLHPRETKKPPLGVSPAAAFEIANGFFETPVSKPGDDLLFHCLSSSTIGAVRFHGRVRDGIGWVTDAMVTKLWDRRFEVLEIVHLGNGIQRHLAEIKPTFSRAVGDGGTLKREMSN